MTESTAPKQQFGIKKLYLKDASYESPGTPQSFGFAKWEPKVELNLTNTHTHIEGDLYEGVLNATVTVQVEDKTVFLIEVQYAGLFGIVGFSEEERSYLLGSQCMTVMFPYAREVISDLTVRGGFPPLILSPVNFDALYQQHLEKQKAGQAESEATH